MTRDQKIQYLRLIQQGFKPKDFTPLPELILNAVSGDISALSFEGIYLAARYKCPQTGAEYTADDVLNLINERKGYDTGVLPAVSGSMAFWLLFRGISTAEQIAANC